MRKIDARDGAGVCIRRRPCWWPGQRRGGCVKKARQRDRRLADSAMFQAWEAVLQATDWGSWAQFMTSGMKVGSAPGYKVSNMRYELRRGRHARPGMRDAGDPVQVRPACRHGSGGYRSLRPARRLPDCDARQRIQDLVAFAALDWSQAEQDFNTRRSDDHDD